MAEKRPGGKGVVREYIEAIVVALSVALMLRFFVVEAFKIPSGSMIETLEIGDFIFVNKLSYRWETPYALLGQELPFGGKEIIRFRDPKPGDVAVFRWPNDPTVDYIKRLMGTPGDTLEGRRGELYVNGEQLQRKFIRTVNFEDQRCASEKGRLYEETLGDRTYTIIRKDGSQPYGTFGPVKVRDDHLFAMGDNRDNSSDSRAWGQVPISNVKGRALFVWLSVDPCQPLAGRFRLSRIGHAVK